VCVCDLENSKMGWSRPNLDCYATDKKKNHKYITHNYQ